MYSSTVMNLDFDVHVYLLYMLANKNTALKFQRELMETPHEITSK